MKKLLRLISVATMLLAATTFMACSSDDDDDSGARSVSARTSGSIVGVVLDNKGEPVEGATVTLGGKTAKTNYGGEFEITGVNPNDSKLISAAKTVTTTTTVHTDTDNTVTNKPKTDTSISTSSKAETSSGNDITEVKDTGYTLTVKKDGYLSGKVTGVYVTYQDTEDPEVTRANALLHGLEYDYQDILDRYAAALANANNNTSGNGNAVGTTATTVTSATQETTTTTTVQTGSNADRVFKDISEAISALKSMYRTGNYTEYFSTFGESTPLIPLDASLKGKIKLNLSAQRGSTYDAETYTPKSNPTVHVSYTSGTYKLPNGTSTTTVAGADYTWAAKVDSDGNFVFDKCLPSGVPLTITVDSFFEKIKVGEVETEYTFSSESSEGLIVNATKGTTTETTTSSATGTSTTVTSTIEPKVLSVKLGSKDANEESIVLMLFAQKDKIWITATNVDSTATGKTLATTDALTFTFNKAMKSAEFTASNISNLKATEYTAEWTEDKKTVTLKPTLGYWKLAADSSTITIKGEAVDGATDFLLQKNLVAYFDTKVWVSLKEDKVSYKDYNDYLKLSDPITLVFSKAMNDKVAVHLYKSYADNSKPENSSAYTESWSEDKTTLTLTPVAEAKYWDVSDKSLKIVVEKEFASSATTYNNDFGYWKTGAAKLKTDDTSDNCLEVYFDNYNDVTLTKVSDSEFTVTFAKALKALNETEIASNISIGCSTTYKETESKASTVTDVKYTLDAARKVLTVKAKGSEFTKYGYYSIYFTKDVFVAETGEKNLRKAGTVAATEDHTSGSEKTPFVTTFTLGTEFKLESITYADDLPTGALASRVAYVDFSKYLKLSFNKEVRDSKLDIVKEDGTSYSTNATNYIAGKDVYIPLNKLTDNIEIYLNGSVTSVTGDPYTATKFNTLYKVNAVTYKMVASSLYEEVAAIARANNDVTVKQIKPTATSITFTFNQDVSAANWTAEFYDKNTVAVKNLKETLYKVTAKAEKEVVTVTFDADSKKLAAGKNYFLSLKATKGTAKNEVVLFDSSADVSATNYGNLSDGSTLLGEKITSNTTSGNNKRYITVDTYGNYVVPADLDAADGTSKTTSFAAFNKSNTSAISIQFTEDITGYKGELVNAANVVNTGDDLADLDKTKTYTSESKVDGNVLTITPKYAFSSNALVVPVVYNAEGKAIKLSYFVGDSEKDFFTVDTTPDSKKCFVARTLAAAGTAAFTKVLDDSAIASSDLTLSYFNKAKTGTGSAVHLYFKPLISQISNTTKFGTYTLYKKAAKASAAAAVWTKVEGANDWTVGTGSNVLKSVDINKTTDELKITSVSLTDTDGNDFSIRKLNAYISDSALAGEFDFSPNVQYRLVCTLDNDVVYSNILTVEDKAVVLEAKNGSSKFEGETVGATETPVSIASFTVTSGYLVEYEVKVTRGITPVSDTNKRISDGKVKAILDATRKVLTITIESGTKVAKGDKIAITGHDGAKTSGTLEIEYK